MIRFTDSQMLAMELKKKTKNFGGCNLQRNSVTFKSHLTSNRKPAEVNREIPISFTEFWTEFSVSLRKSVLLVMVLKVVEYRGSEFKVFSSSLT